MAAAAFSFAGCQVDEMDAPIAKEEGSTFEFVANIAQTKTTLDVANGYKVDWEEGDVIYMVTSDGTWGKPYNDDKTATTIAEFTYADGKFTSDATIADGNYTFKGMYAAASQKSYHRGASSTHKLEATQAQNCANPTAHIKANDALVGAFTATVPMAEMSKMNMSHLYTLMQVNVKNATGAAIEITKFEMTAEGAALAAIFNVTAFDTPAITTKQNESSTITVNVTGGSVQNNASLPVYFVMAPLANYAGDVTFKVTDSEGKTYTKTVAMNGISFEAGKYNTTPYTIKEADVVEPEPEGVMTATISFASTAQRTSYSKSQQEWENDGVTFTNDKAKSTTNVADYSNPVRLYKSSTITISAPGNITKVEFNCSPGDYLTNLQKSLTGHSTNGNSVVMELDGSSNSVTYTLSGGQVRLNSLTVTYVIADPSAPSITAGNVTDVSARGVEAAELTYEIANLEYSDLTVTCDETVVTSASKGKDGVINYVVSVNSTTSAREGVITITAGTLTKEVKVSQKAPVFTVSKTEVVLEADAEANLSVTVTSDFDWIAEASDNAGFTFTPDEYVWEEKGKQSVKISAKAANDSEEGTITLGIITLTNLETNEMLTITVKQESSYVAAGSVTESISFASTTQRVSQDNNSQVWKNGGVTFTNEKASSSTAVGNYFNPVRLYQGSNVKISATGKITEVVIESDGTAKYKTALQNSLTGAGYTYKNSGNNYTITLTSPAESVEFSLTAQARFKSLKVTYQN